MLDGSDDLYLLGDLSVQMHASSIGQGVPHRKSHHDQDHGDAECERRHHEAHRYQGDQRGDRDHAWPGQHPEETPFWSATPPEAGR
jgi:hypothetical protein